MERLIRKADICEIYGLSEYEAETVMRNVRKINVGRGTIKPRWATTATEVDAYLNRKVMRSECSGLTADGKLIRR